MTTKKRGLGRDLSDLGLTELLSEMQISKRDLHNKVSETDLFQLVDVDQIYPCSSQPRKRMDPDSLKELAESIRSQGVIQPLIVRPKNPDTYEIVAGERRWRASKIAGLTKVPVVIRNVPDKTAAAIALIENIQRCDLNAIEEALAIQRLIVDFHLTHQEVSDLLGKSRTLVTNLLRLLKLNPDVRLLVETSKVEMGHARALLGLVGAEQSKLAKQVVAQDLSVRQTEVLVRRIQQGQESRIEQKTRLDPNVSRLQNELSDLLGAQVNIQQGHKGTGKLIVKYHSLDELEGILEKVRE